MAAPTTTVSIFLSWCHQDARLKEALLRDLLPALGSYRDLTVHWWEDSHLTCGEELTEAILANLDQADYGLLLLSTRYFGRDFIRRHELPRFAGNAADKGSLPVALSPLQGYGEELDWLGVQSKKMFTLTGKSFGECSGVRRTRFANDLAGEVRRRCLGLNGYRTL